MTDTQQGANGPGEGTADRDDSATGSEVTQRQDAGDIRAVSATYARTQNLVAAGVILLVSVVAAVMSASLGVGSLAEPEPGMWPLIVSVVLVAFSVVLLLQSGQKGDEQAFGRESLIVVVAVVSLIAYAALFENIGFEVPTVAILMLWIKGLGRQSWITSLSVSFGSCAVIYAVFISALGVPLPHIVVF